MSYKEYKVKRLHVCDTNERKQRNRKKVKKTSQGMK